jgi:hypothetical protein
MMRGWLERSENRDTLDVCALGMSPNLAHNDLAQLSLGLQLFFSIVLPILICRRIALRRSRASGYSVQ